MKTVIAETPLSAIASLIADRQRLGLDTHDELWQGEYRMAPAPNAGHGLAQSQLIRGLGPHADEAGLFVTAEFNLGDANNYRVPDLGFHRSRPDGTWVPTAAVVVEVRSPDDESYEKFGHYFDHGVEEILVADLASHTVQWFRRGDAAFEPVETSEVLTVNAAATLVALGW